ncbi:InlB B-repeat-containing protein [Pimelobacter simplex]|uniref:InlB B-repeat-containing protein n=1 Tax=Nocardioides simplex TaxID=2045 RepID=UPI00382ED81F
MTCLPATGGPAAGLLLLGVALVAVGLVLAFPRRTTRVLTASLLVLAVVGASTLTPTEAHAASQDCAPDGTGGEPSWSGAGAGAEADGPFDVTYSPGRGGRITGPAEQRVRAGQDAEPVRAVADAGYRFTGWSDGVTTARRHDRDVDADLHVSARFAPLQHTLTYLAGPGGTLGGTTPQRVDHGSSGTAVTAVPDAGQRFVRWSDGSTTNPRTDSDVTADLTVTAEFASATHRVRYLAGAGGAVTGDVDQTVAHGADATPVTALAGASHHFVRWSDGSTTNPRTDAAVVADLTVTAEFAVTVHRLQYVAGPGGSLTGDLDQQVQHGASGSAVTAVPDPGRTFVQWSDGSTDNPRTDSGVIADATLTAVFATQTYVLTYAAGPGGSVSPAGPQVVDHGSNGPSVTAAPLTGYRFVRWSDGSTANPRTDTGVTANLAVTAEFAVRTYTVTYAAGPGGSLGGTTPQTVDHGTGTTPVTAVPDPGFRFVRWSDGSTANPRTDNPVTADLTVTAEFAVRTYDVRYLAGPGGSVSGDTDQTVEHGADATAVTAVPDAGFRFVQWSDGSTTNPRTDAAVVADLTVTAEFDDALDLAVHESARGALTTTTPRDLVVTNPGAVEAEYVLVPTNTGAGTTDLTVAVAGNAPMPAANPGGTAAAADPHATARRDAVALAQAARGSTGTGTPLSPPARLPSGTPAVGDPLRLNVDLDGSCTTGLAATATVQAVGTHVVIASDDSNPVGGFLDTDYTELLTTLDAMVPGVTGALGDLTDRDANGRVVVLVTRAVNELTPPATSTSDYVYSRPRDLLGQTACPTSNVGEIVYAMAPDPTGAVNSNVRTLSSVKGQIPTGLAHELGHQIMDGVRLDAGTPLDGTWLAEAVADSALDAAFYARSVGLTPLQNIVLSNVTTGPNAAHRVAAFNTYINADFGRYRPWLQAPTVNSVLAGTPSQASRGGAWAFVGYAADRKSGGSLSARTAFLRSLVTGPGTGTATLAAALGEAPERWLEDFAVAAYTDDLVEAGPLGTSGPFAMLSWSFRSLYGGLGGYPLATSALDADTSITRIYAPRGGSRHVLFRVAAGATATLTLTALTVNPEIGYRLVRLR